jgi:hypothetical protein
MREGQYLYCRQMPRQLFACAAGAIVLPVRNLVLVDRRDGGNLIVTPRREVWERSELTAGELTRWSFLVAATGRAMLDVLPVLDGGCVNYWEAGNWALHPDAEPRGPKTGPGSRSVHLHLLGRSRSASSPAYTWGEAPAFPRFHDRHAWSSGFERLEPAECRAVIDRAIGLLETKYGLDTNGNTPAECHSCGYPAAPFEIADGVCLECHAAAAKEVARD